MFLNFFKKFIVLVVIFLIGFLIGFNSGEHYALYGPWPKSEPPKPPPENSQQLDLSLFWEALDLLKKNYFRKELISSQDLLYGAISGMVKSLKDPYTSFLNPKDTKKLLEDVSGEFEGIGIEIGIRKNQLMIIAPLEGTPAQKAGLRAGDRILFIDETPTVDLTLDEAVSLIRGPKGTNVTLTISRDDSLEPIKISITRDRIQIPSLKWELKEGNIAYVKLFHFTQKAESDFRKMALEIIASEAKGIILDLRNNPGGFLEVSQTISGWFLPKGAVVTFEKFADGSEKPYLSPGPSRLQKYPLVVLINEGSASAAEILAAALRENKGVKLVGQKTFGKGSVQQVLRLSDDSSLKITVAEWLTPKKNLIENTGLMPDFEIALEKEHIDKNQDPQLEKAIEIIKQVL